ncbi:MAG: ATP synthase F1 subunit delta [Phycisphaerae bacterium]
MTDVPNKFHTALDPEMMSLAGVYAQAALNNIPGNDAAEELAAELKALIDMLDSVDGFDMLLTRSLMNRRERMRLVERVFAGRVSEQAEALLGVLTRHDRLMLIRGVYHEFRRRLNMRQGKVEINLVTARPLDDAEQEQVRTIVAKSLGAEPILHTTVDPGLLGGLSLRIGDRVYDSSVVRRLEELKKRIAEQLKSRT